MAHLFRLSDEARAAIDRHLVRARDTRSDFPLRQRLYAAGLEIERLKLRGTPVYNDAVLRADRNSWPR